MPSLVDKADRARNKPQVFDRPPLVINDHSLIGKWTITNFYNPPQMKLQKLLTENLFFRLILKLFMSRMMCHSLKYLMLFAKNSMHCLSNFTGNQSNIKGKWIIQTQIGLSHSYSIRKCKWQLSKRTVCSSSHFSKNSRVSFVINPFFPLSMLTQRKLALKYYLWKVFHGTSRLRRWQTLKGNGVESLSSRRLGRFSGLPSLGLFRISRTHFSTYHLAGNLENILAIKW